MSQYVFKPYNPIFPKLFEAEKERLRILLGDEPQIEHVGSTAVGNLGGKGIIDIYVATSKDNLEKVSEKLTQAGYRLIEEDPTQIRHVTHVADLPDPVEDQRRYHIHLGTLDNENFKRMIVFRDYLRNHPKDLKKYAEIKQTAADLANNNRDEYLRIKGPIIEEIIENALNSQKVEKTMKSYEDGKLKYSDIYELVKNKVGLKEDKKYHELYNPKDPWGESLGYLALRNFKRFIALLYYLIAEKKFNFDLIVGGGDSGVSLVKVAEMVYQQLGLRPPLALYLPIVRWDPKWLEYKGQPTELFDNSILIPQINDQINELEKLENILFVDDEIANGYTAKATFKIVKGAIDKDKISKNLNLTIVSENQGFNPDGFIDGVETEFYYFSVDNIDGINNILSYVIPWSIEKQVRDIFSDDQISSKAFMNSLLDLPSKEFERFDEYIKEKPEFTNRQLDKLRKEIPNFPNLQVDFTKSVIKWINEALEEFKF